MIAWYSRLSKKVGETVNEECSRCFYDQVIRCMSLDQDLEGTVVALYVMKQLFGLNPNHDTARMITLQLARVATRASWTPSRTRRLCKGRAKSKGNVDKMNQLLTLVLAERADILQGRGIDVTKLTEEEKQEELLIVLTTYLQVVMRQNDVGKVGFAERIQSAARAMGAPDLSEVLKQLTAR